MNPVWIVVGIAVLGLLITAVDLVASPTYRRLAVRSISRRRGEAMLIVVGAMFGTAIIGTAVSSQTRAAISPSRCSPCVVIAHGGLIRWWSGSPMPRRTAPAPLHRGCWPARVSRA